MRHAGAVIVAASGSAAFALIAAVSWLFAPAEQAK
jgi:hypothetical protein